MSDSEVTLQHFYVFNSTYAEKEGEVNRKILLTIELYRLDFSLSSLLVCKIISHSLPVFFSFFGKKKLLIISTLDLVNLIIYYLYSLIIYFLGEE